MGKKMIGLNGLYKIIQVNSSPIAMYKSLDKEEFIGNKNNPTLREYLNYMNLYDATGIVAFNLGEFRVVPSNLYHLQYLLCKVQLKIFGESDIEEILPSKEMYDKLNSRVDEISTREAAQLILYKIDQEFDKGNVLEECCNIGGQIKFNDFQTLFWVYEMLLLKAEGKILVSEDKLIESLTYEEFEIKYPSLEVVNLF